MEELSKGCFFIDESGYIYNRAPDFSGPVFMRYYGLATGDAPLRSQYLPADTFRAIAIFLTNVRRLSFEPEAFVLADAYDFELHLKKGPRILFARNSDFATVLENLQSVLDADVVKGKINTLDYIDLRFGNKVYFKEK